MATGMKMRPLYEKYVDLKNEAAKLNSMSSFLNFMTQAFNNPIINDIMPLLLLLWFYRHLVVDKVQDLSCHFI